MIGLSGRGERTAGDEVDGLRIVRSPQLPESQTLNAERTRAGDSSFPAYGVRAARAMFISPAPV